MSELTNQGMPIGKTSKTNYVKGFITPKPQRLDTEFIGKSDKLLSHDEVGEWFEGERELWQENY